MTNTTESDNSVRQSQLHIKPTSLNNEEDAATLPTKADQQATKIAEKMIADCQFSQFLGIQVVTARADYSVCSMVITHQHTNGHGTGHGGAIFSLADTTFAHLCNAHNSIAVGHICTIAYWQAAQLGDELYAYAYESGVHGRSGSYRVEVTRGEAGELIAEFQGFSRALKGQQHFNV